MELRPVARADRAAFDALVLARSPSTETWFVESLFSGGFELDAFLVGTVGDDLAAAGFSGRVPGTPTHQRSVLVLVAAAHGGRGLGSRLLAELRAAQPSEVVDLRTRVFDDDPLSLEVARHWGYEVTQRSITSALELHESTPPAPPDGVTLEQVDDLVFPDQDAAEAMFEASQTNPEARNNHLMTLSEVREYVFPGEWPLVTVARVDGEPAALCYLIVGVDPEEASVVYTGVDPRFRGRGLARLVKAHVHERARSAGVLRLVTDNEEHNEGIRRINADMGFVKRYGSYRMRKDLIRSAPSPG